MIKDTSKRNSSNEAVVNLFYNCVDAIKSGKLINRISETDKEFSFQKWIGNMLAETGMFFDEPSRNAYPDFRLVNQPIGFEVKGLGYPGREAN